MKNELVKKISQEMAIPESNCFNAIKLLFEEECTIPFVARYRKEMTGTMDEVVLRDVRDRYTYLVDLEAMKSRYFKVLQVLSKTKPELASQLPELEKKFYGCTTKAELEDLYLPYKPKRKTRAQDARHKGLDKLTEEILAGRKTIQSLREIAEKYVTKDPAVAEALKVPDVDAALLGARDIFAEDISETADYRQKVRTLSFDTGFMVAKKNEARISEKAKEDKDERDTRDVKKTANADKFQNYFDYRESINTAPPHRILAVRRGEAEKVLRFSIEVDRDQILQELKSSILEKDDSQEVSRWLTSGIEDAYKRLMSLSMETEIRMMLRTKAEDEAIRVFADNLKRLLLLPPIPNKATMGVDPGIRTGSKLAVLSQTGKLLAYETIYPDVRDLSAPKSLEAAKRIGDLLEKHQVECVAIGNGTGGRTIDQLVNKVIKERNLTGVKKLVVNEAGASVYSTDDLAREEFPDLDPTIRSAVSIGRRLQDPLAELVKIDPKSIGVGQYQHDCDAKKLGNTLGETVESCVNKVGVSLNTASQKLLGYVSGISQTLAKNIVAFREKNGKFESRAELLSIPGFGEKTFEQAAGFLRIPGGKQALDNSAVHPESYSVIEKMSNDLHVPVEELIANETLVRSIPLERYVDEKIGLPTLMDIVEELIKPGRDPREGGAHLTFSEHVQEIEDLKPGMKLKGTVSNVTNFGAFVDIGVHQDGLVHISELSDKFVKDPNTVVAVGDVVDVWVIDIDQQRKRISLSCKSSNGTDQSKSAPASAQNGQNGRNGQQGYQGQQNRGSRPSFQQSQQSRPSSNQRNDGPRRDQPRNNNNRNQRGPQPQQGQNFSVGDLLSKFNSRL